MSGLRKEIRPAVHSGGPHEQAQGTDALSDMSPGIVHGVQDAPAHGVPTRPVQRGGGQDHEQEG